MIGFGIDEIQAEYVAEIRLRHLNREYILKRTEEIDKLESDIREMEEILKSAARVRGIIVDELKEVGKKYGSPPRQCCTLPRLRNWRKRKRRKYRIIPVPSFLAAEGLFKK